MIGPMYRTIDRKMWTIRNDELAGGHLVKFGLDLDSSPVSYAEVLRRWQVDADFRLMFNELLAGAPFAAFRWETPSVSTATVKRPFEFVLVDSPGLAAHPDDRAFAERFQEGHSSGVVEFTNLGRDAILIVPCPRGPAEAYGHLASFVRQAPEAQQHALWRLVGAAAERRLGPKPVWLSTAGAGVSWLHVRLDDRPKYYSYAPYRAT